MNPIMRDNRLIIDPTFHCSFVKAPKNPIKGVFLELILYKSQPTQVLHFSFQGQYLKYLTTEWYRPWYWYRAWEESCCVRVISFICWIVGKSGGLPEGRSLIGGTLLRGLSTLIIYQLVEKYLNILTIGVARPFTHTALCVSLEWNMKHICHQKRK